MSTGCLGLDVWMGWLPEWSGGLPTFWRCAKVVFFSFSFFFSEMPWWRMREFGGMGTWSSLEVLK